MALKIIIILILSINSAFALVPKITEYHAQRDSYYEGTWSLSRVDAIVAWCAWRLSTDSNYLTCVPRGDFGYTYSVGDSVYNDSLHFTTRSVCPANSTESGSQCICNDGFSEENGYCVAPTPPDPCFVSEEINLQGHCSAVKGDTQSWVKSGKSSGAWTCREATAIWPQGFPLFPGCNRGCLGENGGFDMSMQDDEGHWFTTGSAKMTGSTCDPSVIEDLNGQADPQYEPEATPEPKKQPDPTCTNGFKGTVNGVSVCVPPKATSGITEMEEKDNGDGTKTNNKTEVKCENGKCEITKTSTTTNTETNTTVSSSSVTTTVDKSKFCSENKTAGACKDEKGENEDGDGKFGGSCSAGYECKGDAVMCAMAKEQHKRNCEMLEPVKDGIFKQIQDGTDTGSADAMKGEAQQINISTQLNTSGYGLSRSCPADPVIDLPFVSRSFTIPFSQACPILKTMSDVALLITALSLLIWLVAPKGRQE